MNNQPAKHTVSNVAVHNGIYPTPKWRNVCHIRNRDTNLMEEYEWSVNQWKKVKS